MTTNSLAFLIDAHFKMNQDYLLDLVADLFDQERYVQVDPNYYETVQDNEINPKMRTKLVEWMIQLADEMKLGYKTKQMSVIMADMILSRVKIHKKYLQLLGITIIFINVKSEESFIYTLAHACEHCAHAYTKDEISAMEMLILKTLRWKLQYPTSGEIARRLVQLANPVLSLNLAKFFKKADNFIELAISEFDTSIFSPTAIAVAAVMCAFESSVDHVIKWRAIMMQHFNINFEEKKIDILYQSIIQKLQKLDPDYFRFPTMEDLQNAAANYENGLTPNANEETKENGMALDSPQQMNEGMNMGQGMGAMEMDMASQQNNGVMNQINLFGNLQNQGQNNFYGNNGQYGQQENNEDMNGNNYFESNGQFESNRREEEN